MNGCTGVHGYSGAAKKTAACAGMTLWFASSIFHGVTGVFGNCTIAKCMYVDAVLEPYVSDAVTIAELAMGRGTAARKRQCD